METAVVPAFRTAIRRRAVQGAFDVDHVRKGIRPVGGAAGESVQHVLRARRRNAKGGSATKRPSVICTSVRSGTPKQRACWTRSAASRAFYAVRQMLENAV
jgi:hypothetical protein